eukprot:GHVT01091808.1.p1 GENE.GHVT01091808.1~~GHVT01091808.1.p1  ORF type:complete len:260 (+),score=28.16 GHVT01091808.1:137-916(+)
MTFEQSPHSFTPPPTPATQIVYQLRAAINRHRLSTPFFLRTIRLLIFSLYPTTGQSFATSFYHPFLLFSPHSTKMATDLRVAPLLAELVGSFFVVLTVGLVIHSALATVAPFAIAAIVMVLIYALGPVSGGHFNPAISLGVFLTARRQLPLLETMLYFISQLAGGLGGGMMSWMLTKTTTELKPMNGGVLEVCMAEGLYSACLVFMVLCVTCASGYDTISGVCIAANFLVASTAVGHISGQPSCILEWINYPTIKRKVC